MRRKGVYPYENWEEGNERCDGGPGMARNGKLTQGTIIDLLYYAVPWVLLCPHK